MNEAIPNELARAFARVYANVSRIPKNGRNDFHGYDYVMEGDLVDHLRTLLAGEGVAVFPSVREHVVETTQDHRNRQQFMATVTLDVTFIHGDSGQQLTTSWVGQGADSADKSYYKAYTGAFKYALMKTFLISAGDDPEEATQGKPSGEKGGGGGKGSQRRAPGKSRKPESKGKPAPTLPEVERELTKYVSQGEAEKFLLLTATNTKAPSVQEIKPATLGWVMGQLEQRDKIERGAWIMEKIEAGA